MAGRDDGRAGGRVAASQGADCRGVLSKYCTCY